MPIGWADLRTLILIIGCTRRLEPRAEPAMLTSGRHHAVPQGETGKSSIPIGKTLWTTFSFEITSPADSVCFSSGLRPSPGGSRTSLRRRRRNHRLCTLGMPTVMSVRQNPSAVTRALRRETAYYRQFLVYRHATNLTVYDRRINSLSSVRPGKPRSTFTRRDALFFGG